MNVRSCILVAATLLLACGDPGQNGEENGNGNGNGQPDPTAREYCEATREIFCSYYMRCGRMNASSMEECLSIFDESCPAVYQPRYVALEDSGRLALSDGGLEACRGHLESVDCEQQIFDLDGGCAGVWEGLVGPEGACGIGVESFVCEAGTTCVVGLDLCGTCKATVGIGEECGVDIGRCEATASCVDGLCLKRALPGESCGEERACALGSSCVEGVCARFEVVSVGEACGVGRRCQYNAICTGGICESQVGLSSECAAAGKCRSGYCDIDVGVCRPLKEPGESCSSGPECLGGGCVSGSCSELVSACFD